jgi:hypothetical protein
MEATSEKRVNPPFVRVTSQKYQSPAFCSVTLPPIALMIGAGGWGADWYWNLTKNNFK